jgi:hypothetical protein
MFIENCPGGHGTGDIIIIIIFIFIIANDGIRRIVSGGYPVDSGSPYTLWFGSGLRGGWLNDPVMAKRIDGGRLLRQTQMGFWGYLQTIQRNGGDDGTRTRGLCRDRAGLSSTFNDIEEYGRHCKSLEVPHRQRYCVLLCVSRRPPGVMRGQSVSSELPVTRPEIPAALRSRLAKRPPNATTRCVPSGCTWPALFPAHN